MQARRLLNNLQEQKRQHHDAFFGNPRLIDESAPAVFDAVKKVAILTESFLPKVDGVVKTTYLTVRYLQETGREVVVFAPDIAVDRVGDSPVIALPSISLPQAPETRMALPSRTVAQRIEAFQPDLVHLFSPAAIGVNGMAVARHLNLPVIANYQTDLPGYTQQYGLSLLSGPVNRWLRYIHNGCHLTLAPTQTFIRHLRRVGYRRVRHWGRGVNTERFHPRHRDTAMRRRLLNGRTDDSLLCIYVGRLAHEKGIELLRELAQQPGIALTLIGDGALRAQLERDFAHTDSHFTGYLIGDDLARAYASADAFVFPGKHETFGQVIQEAMASALPTIVVNAGGAPDVMQDGYSGITVEASASAFARAVCELREKPQLRQYMSRNARKTAEQRPWSAIMAQLEGYYAEAYSMNQRFKRLFGFTNYYRPLAIPRHLVRRPRGYTS